MLKTIALASAAAVLVIGSIAVAQTAPSTTDANGNPVPATDQNGNNNGGGATAPAATQNGSDTAATTSNTAGERG